MSRLSAHLAPARFSRSIWESISRLPLRHPAYLLVILVSAIGLLFLVLQAHLASAWFTNRGAITVAYTLTSPHPSSADRELALQRAETHFQAALELNPRLPSAIRQLGEAQLAQRQFQLAATTLSRGLDLNPGDTLFHFLLGQTYDALGQNEAAVHEWKKAGASALYFANLSSSTLQKGDPEIALTYALRALRIDPDSAWSHRAAGKSYQALGAYDEALRAYQTALASSHQLTRLERAQVHRDLGRLLLEAGHPVADAVEQFQEALRLGPRESEGHILMGLAFQTSGDVDKAVQWYRSAIRVNPRDEFAYLHLAELYESQGRLTEAFDWYQQAIAQHPDSAEAHFHLGAFYHRRGNLEPALVELQTSVKLAPRNNRFRLALADCYRAAGKLTEAIREYEVVLDLDGDNESALQALAALRGAAP